VTARNRRSHPRPAMKLDTLTEPSTREATCSKSALRLVVYYLIPNS
jgi:hypothetical protein